MAKQRYSSNKRSFGFLNHYNSGSKNII